MIPGFNCIPIGIVAGPDGNLWFTDEFNDTVGRVTTGGLHSSSIYRLSSKKKTATHDFNGDGKSDILWRDTSGNVAMWLMNGATVSSGAAVGNVPTSWSIVGQRDFNGDGKHDMLWRDTSGNVAMWLMNGATVSSSVLVGNVRHQLVDRRNRRLQRRRQRRHSLARHQRQCGDLADERRDDLLRCGLSATSPPTGRSPEPATSTATARATFSGVDSSGDVAIWLMNGTTVSSAVSLGNVPTSWSIVGTGDFNGDGKSDILWRDSSGNVAMWLMNGKGRSPQVRSVGNVPTTWSIVETGDFNGDGKSDILWRDTSGNVVVWLMNGATVSSSAVIGNVPTAWTIQGTNADWGKSGQRWILAGDGLSANDPKRTLMLVEPRVPHTFQVALHQRGRLIGNVCSYPIHR